LTSEVAADYFNLRELDIEIDVIDQGIKLQRGALDFVSSRHNLGDASGLDLAQQQALLDSTTTQIDLLRNQRAQLEHAIATLVGKPAPTFAIQPEVLSLSVPDIPLDLPSDVLQRRPDVASSERAVAAANAQIGVAKAAFFPSLPLFANYGRESNQVANLFAASSTLWSFGVTATQTIFDAGRNQGNLDIAKASYTASVATYRQTVLTAFQEVEDGLAGLGTLARATAQAQAAVKSAQRVLDLANDRYSGGVATYLDVITAQQALLTNQRQAAQIRGQQMVTAVFLVKALGGGWSPSGTPAASTEVGLLQTGQAGEAHVPTTSLGRD
jgi:NodT family efflux transporter outer membrane factor (OMF) lipoprotein